MMCQPMSQPETKQEAEQLAMPQATDNSCPNCRTPGMQVFYRTGEVPVHSCLMMEDEDAARRFPRRPISLGFCSQCGLVANVLFDPNVHNYAGKYEDQQSFSRRFREFQSSLIGDWIERFDLRNRTVVEIGCGKGDFLLEFCRTGNNRGIGIDPRSDRAPHNQPADVEFLPDYYSRKHWDIPCDVVVCRHTLEHIHDIDTFLQDIRSGLGRSPGTLIFFEVPDSVRVFREVAFWDIYYEHCSYFTPGSLARAFRRNGFEVLDLRRVFENQYLTIVARPTTEPEASSTLPDEESPAELGAELQLFAQRATQKIADWRTRLAALHHAGKRVAVWGAGSKCVAFLSTLECEHAVNAVIDINPNQQGKYLPGSGKRIMPPDALRSRHPDVVLIMNPVYRDEIARQLESMEVRAELICV